MASKTLRKRGLSSVFDKKRRLNCEKTEKIDFRAQQAGKIAGRYITESYADGNAVYVVAREYKTQMLIKALTGLSDDWRIPYWGDKATVDKDYIVSKIRQRDALAEMFQRNKSNIKQGVS
jgi:hypothetical protein